MAVIYGVCALAVVLLSYAVFWFYQQSRRLVLTKPDIRILNFAEGAEPEVSPSEIPAIIWTYWHSEQQPEVVKRSIAGWKKINPNFQVHVLHSANLSKFIDPVPENLMRLNIAKQTDWIRLELLNRYGGIWLDASIIITRPLDWIEQLRAKQGSNFVGYYLSGYTTNQQNPVVDSWFLAAPARSPFIRDWLALFTEEVIVGETSNYIATLSAAGRLDKLKQGIADPYYHTIHLAAQDVLEKATGSYRLCLIRAEDDAYALQQVSQWRRWRLFMRLLFNQHDELPALIKLRGGERTKLEGYLRFGLYRNASIVGRFLSAESCLDKLHS